MIIGKDEKKREELIRIRNSSYMYMYDKEFWPKKAKVYPWKYFE